ncbi:MAG: Branched-chain amino acid aminotransferase [uncultured Sphingomonadaceae bacterium]|uniref:Branched-chain-amino-acid aminotransferase n=1 Tax=uncultured Sphingomonadaceae bacterium TaxID=169976 RepID=A0A6J4THX0_9SPHN|nr:MAG: Branched-chain amino acid aminotransferase [uncultured Sphingomonadaceae bacterium]
MHGTNLLSFVAEPHPAPMDPAERAALLRDPGFGRAFTDHMVSIRFEQGRGWHDARVGPRRPLEMDPASAVFHYAQEIFEGLKAYKLADGGAALFRADANAARFRASAERMAMPVLPDALFLQAVRELVAADRAWFPDIPGGSLYLRPFMIADEAFLGVRPASRYLFLVIATAAGAYFRGGAPAVTLWTSEDYTRAAPGGTGAAKCGGNYAGSLAAQAEAIRHGCDQVVFLDAAERRWVEELGGMNLFFAFADGSLRTPPLSGTILPGITRDSLLAIARDAGVRVEEERYALADWRADAESGRLTEAFACGTAAVVTPIGRVRGRGFDFAVGGGAGGPVAAELKAALTGIQLGERPDPHGWVERLF